MIEIQMQKDEHWVDTLKREQSEGENDEHE